MAATTAPRPRRGRKKSLTASHRPAPQPRRFRHDAPKALDMFCADERTEILTDVGWKRYNDLAVGDVTLTIRADGSVAEWQPVTAVNVFPAQRRKMQSIEGRGMSALTTDNHRWLARIRTKTYLGGGRNAPRYGEGLPRFGFRRSDELTVDHAVPMAAPVANLPSRPSVPDALVELVAWYWTEGSDRVGGRVHIVQDHVVNPGHVDAIRSALTALFGPERASRKRSGGPQWAENRWGQQTTFGLNREAAHALCAAAPNKVLAIDWLRWLTQGQLDLLIQRSLDADGHERTRASGSTERVLTQGDVERAGAFQAACLIAGRAASMKRHRSTYRHGSTVREVESWAVTVGMRLFVKPLRQKTVEWVDYDGIVWCPTTPNGTWLARRNGTCYFTGNSGFGGMTGGIKRAGFDVIEAANHNEYKVRVHEKNHPEVNHWIADLVDEEASDYHSAADLPRADMLAAGVSCTSHSQANTEKAYAQGLTLFELDEDPDYEERVTRSERDRATALCVLQYAARHHPRIIMVECTTEFQSWGPALPNRPKVGDGTTYRWWLRELDKLDYAGKTDLFLNSMFFGVPQSRNRWFGIFWKKSLRAPDLEHRPMSWCAFCDEVLPAVWTWKTGIPATGSVNYGKQYNYRCPRCTREVIPPMSPAINALDLTDLGPRIGDRPIRTFKDGSTGPLAAATMARARRCQERFAEFPAILMPAKATRGVERHLWQPMSTQTSQQETALLTAVDNFQGGPRGVGEPLPTQVGSETLALVSAGILPYRKNTRPTMSGEAMPTVTADQIPALIAAAGLIKNNGAIGEASYRAHPVDDPFGTLVASTSSQALMTSGWLDPAAAAEWQYLLSQIPLEACHFRMLRPYEVGLGCGFDVEAPGRPGTFVVWGSARNQVDGYGNAVSPPVAEWIGSRLRPILDSPDAYASPWAGV